MEKVFLIFFFSDDYDPKNLTDLEKSLSAYSLFTLFEFLLGEIAFRSKSRPFLNSNKQRGKVFLF